MRSAWTAWCEMCGRHEAEPDKHGSIVVSIIVFWSSFAFLACWIGVDHSRFAANSVLGDSLAASVIAPSFLSVGALLISAQRIRKFLHGRKWTREQKRRHYTSLVVCLAVTLVVFGLSDALWALRIPFVAWCTLSAAGGISHLVKNPLAKPANMATLDPQP